MKIKPGQLVKIPEGKPGNGIQLRLPDGGKLVTRGKVKEGDAILVIVHPETWLGPNDARCLGHPVKNQILVARR